VGCEAVRVQEEFVSSSHCRISKFRDADDKKVADFGERRPDR